MDDKEGPAAGVGAALVWSLLLPPTYLLSLDPDNHVLFLTDRLNFFLTWSFTVINGFQRCIVLASFQRAVTQLWVVSIDYTGISPLLKPTPAVGS